MNVQMFKEKLERFIDIKNLTDEQLERLYTKEVEREQQYFEQQLKEALREGIRKHR